MKNLAGAIALVLMAAAHGPAMAADLPNDSHVQRWVPLPPGVVLRSGNQLSDELVAYAKAQGWTVQWQLTEDYFLDADMSVPGKGLVSDVQWVIKSYQQRGAMPGAGIEVTSDARRVVIKRKADAARDIDPVVQMRMSALDFDQAAKAAGQAMTSLPPPRLAPLPAATATSIDATASRLVPIRALPKDPNNPGLRLAPMTGMPVALPASDIRATAALVAAREADRKIAARTAAEWQKKFSAAAADPVDVDINSMLPPPALVVGLPEATASVRGTGAGSGGALALGDASITATPALALRAVDATPAVLSRPAMRTETPKEEWTAANGSSLRSAVESWSKRAGWVIKWEAKVDYPIVGTLSYEGDFLDAIKQIFDAHSQTDRPLHADAYTRQNLILVKE